MNIAINKSNCAYSKQQVLMKNKTKNKNEAFINVLENKISEKKMDSTRIKYFAKDKDGVYYSMHERKDGSTFKVYHPDIKESNTKLVLPKMNLFPQKTLTAGELNEDEVIHLEDLSKTKKIKRPKDGVFASKEQAIQYIKENYNFSDCKFKEANQVMGILYKNGMVSEEERLLFSLKGNLFNHTQKITGKKITNPLYLKYMDGKKHNWFDMLREDALQEIALGSPDGRKHLETANKIKKWLS